jgi:N,N-dimethylformamidase
VLDVSGGGRHATLVNLPARCVKSSNWSGRTLDWRYAPEEYAAVHFHADDLADAGWDVSHRLTIPADWESGCYALRLRDSSGEWHVPFFVRPRQGAPVKDVAYLIPTCTYAAYANLHLRIWARFNELNHGRLTVLDETDLLLLEMPALGKSTYDAHSDGSAVFYSSMRRPVTNFRPKGRIYKFCQDLLLVDWLEHEDVGFDVVTDEDLHREGLAALSGYRVVIAAPHPEYYTRTMLDSLEEYLGQGGRLMVLGGNTFWWATEYHPLRTGTVEVRRPGLGMLWSADLSEGGFSLSGEPGGPWRKVGRPPEVLAGSGFITQGFDESRPYHRRTDAAPVEVDGRWGFVFEGVEGDTVGDHGFLQGGAAGYEIDRANYDAGTPRHATVLASSDDHSNIYQNVIEVLEDKLPATREGAPDPVRADIVVFDTAAGGAVFSVGSIAWSGSLATDDYDNDVSRITANVLRRFLDPAPID